MAAIADRGPADDWSDWVDAAGEIWFAATPGGDRPVLVRKGAGLSQRELALRTGVAQPTIARIEGGRVDPRVTTLERLLSKRRADERRALLRPALRAPGAHPRHSWTIWSFRWQVSTTSSG